GIDGAGQQQRAHARYAQGREPPRGGRGESVCVVVGRHAGARQSEGERRERAKPCPGGEQMHAVGRQVKASISPLLGCPMTRPGERREQASSEQTAARAQQRPLALVGRAQQQKKRRAKRNRQSETDLPYPAEQSLAQNRVKRAGL